MPTAHDGVPARADAVPASGDRMLGHGRWDTDELPGGNAVPTGGDALPAHYNQVPGG